MTETQQNPPNGVRFIASPGPLVLSDAAPRIDGVVPPGQSIFRMLSDAGLDQIILEHGRVQVVDPLDPGKATVVPPGYWHSVFPKPGVVVVAGIVPMGGGGGGKKSPLRTVLTLAVLVASFYVSAYVGAQAFAKSFAVLGGKVNLLGAAAGGLTSLVGNALVNAIAPPPAPRLADVAARAGITDDPVYTITGASNRARPYQPKREVFGRRRVFPDLGAEMYTEIVNNKTFLRMLLEVGKGPLNLSDWKIRETPLADFSGVELETRRGFPLDVLTAKGDWDPSGGVFPSPASFGDVYDATAAGTVDGVSYVSGDSIVFNGLGADTSAASWDKNGNKPLTLYTDDVHQDTLGGGVRLTFDGGWHTRRSAPDADELILDFSFPRGLVELTGQNSRSPVTVVADVQISPAGAGTFTDVQWANATDGGFDVDGEVTITDEVAGGEVRRSGRIKLSPPGQYDIQTRRTTPDATSNSIIDETFWSALRTVIYRDPVVMPGLALAALRIEASDETQQVIDTVNCIAEAHCEIYDAGSQTWSWALSRNPAHALLKLLLRHKRPLPKDRLNLASLTAWEAACDVLNANGNPLFTFDAVYETANSVREVAGDITAAGRARLGMPDGRWGVVTDSAGATPVQAITPSNSWGFRETETYVDLPHALLVKFEDEEAGYRVSQLPVYADGHDKDTATDFEVMDALGIARLEQAHILGRYHQAVAELRPSTYQTRMDVEYMDFERGDPVVAAHPVILTGLGDGRIKTLILDGDEKIIGVDLTERMIMAAGKEYGVRLRRAAAGLRITATLIVKTVPGETATLLFWDNALGEARPLQAADEPAIDDLVMFGEAGLEVAPMLVQGIEPEAEATALITLIDEAPAVLNVDGEAIPARELFMTTPPAAERKPEKPAVTGIVSDETVMVPLPGGGWQPRIVVSVAPRDVVGENIIGLERLFRLSGSQKWERLPPLPADASSAAFPEVMAAKAYDLKLYYVTAGGVTSKPFLETGHVVVGLSELPPSPTDLYVEKLPSGAFRYRVVGDLAVDHQGWRFKWNPEVNLDWAPAVAAHGGVWGADTFESAGFMERTFTVLVKTVDWDGNESEGVAYAVVRLGDQVRDNLVDSVDFGAQSFPGTITGGTLSGGALLATASGSLFEDPAQPLFNDPTDALFDGYETLVYEADFTVLRRGFLQLETDFTGPAVIEYRTGGDAVLFTNPNDPLPDPLFPLAPFITYQGPFEVRPGFEYALRVTIPGSPVQGRIDGLICNIDVPTVTEHLEDVEVPAAGLRLILVNTFEEIIKIGFTVQEAAGKTAVTVRTIDKDVVLGPLVKPFDIVDAAADGLLDIDVQGILKV